MTSVKEHIAFSDFKKVHLRKGTVIKAEVFEEARKPAYKVWVDFGPEIGVLKTSAQITEYYRPEDLPGLAVIGVTNLPSKQIASFRSEFLLTGLADEKGAVRLIVSDNNIPDGALLH